ncbi:rhodanese-like domain-containing protein [Nocardioides sp. AN3]
MSVPTVTVDHIPDPLPEGLNILDVREDIEWAHGHIEGAVHIPLSQLTARVGDVPDGQTLVVCKIGGRSAQATMYLAAHGYEVANLDGGMLEWAGSGRPMVSETGQPPHVV